MFIRALFLVSLFASSASATAMKEVNHWRTQNGLEPFQEFSSSLAFESLLTQDLSSNAVDSCQDLTVGILRILISVLRKQGGID